MTIFEFLRNKSTELRDAQSKDNRKIYAREFFGSENLAATTGEFLFYRAMQVVMQVATAGLLAYGFFHFFEEPFIETFGSKGVIYAQIISATLVIGYEMLKFFTIRRGMFLLIKGLKDDYRFFFKSIVPIAFGLILCYGSWKGANSGAEHMAVAATDKSGEIHSLSQDEAEGLKKQYKADVKAAQEAADREIEAARKALADYQSSVAWKGHIDTRNKEVVSTIKNKTAAIAEAKADKKIEIAKIEAEYNSALKGVTSKKTTALETNGTKQSFYQKTVLYGSIALEVFVFVFIFLIMSWLHEEGKSTPQVKTERKNEQSPNVDETPGGVMGNGQKMSDPKALKEYRLALNQRAVLKTRVKKHFSTGEFDLESLMEQWDGNELRLEIASVELGSKYHYESFPESESEIS